MAPSGPCKAINFDFVDQIPILTERSCSVTLKTLFFKNIQVELLHSFRAKFLRYLHTNFENEPPLGKTFFKFRSYLILSISIFKKFQNFFLRSYERSKLWEMRCAIRTKIPSFSCCSKFSFNMLCESYGILSRTFSGVIKLKKRSNLCLNKLQFVHP